MKSNWKQIIKAGYRVFALMLGVLTLFHAELKVQAAELADTTALCSLTFGIPKAYQIKLADEIISVRLYRIAEMEEDGTFKDIAGYEELKLSELSFSVTAQQLEEKAKDAAVFLQADTWKDPSVNIPYKEFDIVNNQVEVTDLETGLYLVCVKPLQVEKDTYQALPYLISLPTLIETKDSEGEQNQEWNYDLVVDLKLSCKRISTPPDVPPGDTPPDDTPDNPQVPDNEGTTEVRNHKTGDESKIGLLIGGTIFLGCLFFSMCLLEKYSKKEKERQTKAYKELRNEGDRKQGYCS